MCAFATVAETAATPYAFSPLELSKWTTCKIRHAALDRNFLGITPSLVVRINQKLLDEVDGPMLKHGLKEMHGTTIAVPRSRRPNRTLSASSIAMPDSSRRLNLFKRLALKIRRYKMWCLAGSRPCADRRCLWCGPRSPKRCPTPARLAHSATARPLPPTSSRHLGDSSTTAPVLESVAQLPIRGGPGGASTERAPLRRSPLPTWCRSSVTVGNSSEKRLELSLHPERLLRTHSGSRIDKLAVGASTQDAPGWSCGAPKPHLDDPTFHVRTVPDDAHRASLVIAREVNGHQIKGYLGSGSGAPVHYRPRSSDGSARSDPFGKVWHTLWS